MDNGEWIIGSLITGVFHRSGQDIPYILCPDQADYDCFEDFSEGNGIFEVDTATLCQCTGLKDKNGALILEGDIVSIGDKNIPYRIEWTDNGFMGKAVRASDRIGLTYWLKRTEIIGNIFDNPELLEV